MTLYNLDRTSSTYGWGDRRYWGWKTIDYCNGTYQGGVYALAVALRLNLFDNERFALRLFDAVIMALPGIRRRSGSLEEAFPNEHSFCVTAAAAADCLAAVDCIKERLPAPDIRRYLEAIRPSIEFIEANDEHHAVISNHLAAAAAASVLWKKLAKGAGSPFPDRLETIYSHRSKEGWYREYEGADPGYQTLCCHYLGIVYRETKDEKLKKSLDDSAGFLKYFVHPDGTMGGLYGSRDTEVYYPSGCVCNSHVSRVFAAAALELETGIREGNHILPDAVDGGNFVPLLNSYAAAALFLETDRTPGPRGEIEMPYKSCFEKDFPEAGIFVASTTVYYALVNYKKGGTVKVFDKRTGKIDCEDGGLFGQLRNRERFSTRQRDESIGFGERRVESAFYLTAGTRQTPFIFAVVRLMSLLFFRFRPLRETFKKMVVRKLMTGRKKLDGRVVREFEFREDKITVRETVTPPRKAMHVGHYGKARAIHMASAGYYLKQLQEVEDKSNIIEFIPC